MMVSNRVAFWDGDNFVVVCKKCTKEQAKRILQLMAEADFDDTVVAADACAEPVQEPDEQMPPLPEDYAGAAAIPYEEAAQGQDGPGPEVPEGTAGAPAQKVVLRRCRYDGMTPEEVLAQDGDKGYGNLGFLRRREQDPLCKAALEEAMDGYFRKKFRDVDAFSYPDGMDGAACDKWLAVFRYTLTESEEADVAAQTGMLDFASLLRSGTLEQKKGLVTAVISKYAN